MGELLGVLALVAGLIVAFFARQSGVNSERERSRKIAVEAEARRKEQAAKDAGEAMRSAAAERDASLKRPASTIVGDAIRRGE